MSGARHRFVRSNNIIEVTASLLTSVPLELRGSYAANGLLDIVMTMISFPWRSVPVKNIMFVLTVAVLTSTCMAVISMDDSLQHVAKFSHPASDPSSAILSFPEKLETDDYIPFLFKQMNIRLLRRFGMTLDFVALF